MSYGAIGYEKPKENNGEQNDGHTIELDCHVQVLNNTSLQDSNSVVAIVLKSLQDYKRAHPEVQKVILKADNAGCYHCVATVARLWSQRKSIEGLELIGIHFGEPGKGKSICDRHFAIIRSECTSEGVSRKDMMQILRGALLKTFVAMEASQTQRSNWVK